MARADDAPGGVKARPRKMTMDEPLQLRLGPGRAEASGQDKEAVRLRVNRQGHWMDYEPSSLDDEEIQSADSATRQAKACFNESPPPKTSSSQSEEVKRIDHSGVDSGSGSQMERMQNSDDEAQ